MASGDRDAPHASLHSLLTIFVKVCDAVAFATRAASRTVRSPGAVMFGRFGEVFVDYWGFAKIGPPPGEEMPCLQAPESTGKPRSRLPAPEQAAGEVEIDPRVDVYALGRFSSACSPCAIQHWRSDEEIAAQGSIQPSRPEAFAAAPLPEHIPGGLLPERLAAICIRL